MVVGGRCSECQDGPPVASRIHPHSWCLAYPHVDIDNGPPVCYNVSVIGQADDEPLLIYGDELTLRIREAELDRRSLLSPQGIAQRVEVELIKNLQERAPWLIEYGIRKYSD